MRRSLLIILFLLQAIFANAQVPSMEQKLYYSCKVWGFARYFHSEVSTCHVNWDSVLLHVLPLVESAGTNAAFNDALDTMLLAAGPMALSSTYFPDTIKPELKRNRDWSWTASPIFRTDIRTILDTIKNNFRPHAICWVENNDYTTSNLSPLIFPYDTMSMNTSLIFPSQDERLLLLFKYWNIIRYFNPYSYVTDVSWDTTLYHYAVPIANSPTAIDLSHTFQEIAAELDDAHVYGTTYSNSYFGPAGFYRPYIRLMYLENKYVVVRSKVPGINPGDAIISKDGLTTKQWEDSLGHYYSSGNPSVLRRTMCDNILCTSTYGSSETLVVEDSTGSTHTVTVTCDGPLSDLPFFNTFFYPNDSITNIKWTTLPCDIGYVNMGKLMKPDVTPMYNALHKKSAIIFDLRNYPNQTVGDIANLMYPGYVNYCDYTMPDVSYPGTCGYYHDGTGATNATPYTGKVIILFNEVTQSQAEYTSMMLDAMPGAVKVGSQTAGADGNVTEWNLTRDLVFGFTTFGEFYPNGDSTQRIGIVPDTFIRPTRAGIRHYRDEVLEKALVIGGCKLYNGIEQIDEAPIDFKVMPNPANDVVTIKAGNVVAQNITIDVSDIAGRVLMERATKITGSDFTTQLDIRNLSPGMYFVHIKTDGHQYVTKLVKN